MFSDWTDRIAAGEVPQSFPIVLHYGDRDRIYREMNAAGFGVVSLYHTLVPAIDPQLFPASAQLSRRILNLPVHQDATRNSPTTLKIRAKPGQARSHAIAY